MCHRRRRGYVARHEQADLRLWAHRELPTTDGLRRRMVPVGLRGSSRRVEPILTEWSQVAALAATPIAARRYL